MSKIKQHKKEKIDKSLKAFLKDCDTKIPVSVLKENLFFLNIEDMNLNFN